MAAYSCTVPIGVSGFIIFKHYDRWLTYCGLQENDRTLADMGTAAQI